MLGLLMGSDREDDDYHFFRNLHLLAAQSKKTTGNADHIELLDSLVDELSFWDAFSKPGGCGDDPNPSALQEEQRRLLSERSVWTSSASCSSSQPVKQQQQQQQEGTQPTPGAQQSSHCHKPVWKSAVDPASGQTYYYDVFTRHTQWHKPPEVKEMEKKLRAERRQRDIIFFREMERNILESLKRRELIPGIPQSSVATSPHTRRKSGIVDVGPPREPRSPPPQKMQLVTGTLKAAVSGAPARIRTISGMDDVLLAELRDDKNTPAGVRPVQHQRQVDFGHTMSSASASSRRGRPPLPAGPSKRASADEDFDSDPMELSPDPARAASDMHPFHYRNNKISTRGLTVSDSDILAGEMFLDEPIQTETDMIAELKTGDATTSVGPPSGQHLRRNTGGTIYLQNTIYNPDIKATIKCVCAVYRAHIVQAAEQLAIRSPVSVVKGTTPDASDTLDEKVWHDYDFEPSLPTLADVLAFYEEFYGRSQMEHDTIIMSLIYVERLVKSTNGVLAPSADNWRSILFACMVLASKVWDDLSMWNIDFSNVSAATAGLSSFTLPRINQLELALLKALKFNVRVPASEYAKYYFLIRTMLLRSGLVQETPKPLQRRKDDAIFSDLESLTARYQDQTLGMPKTCNSTSNFGAMTSNNLDNTPHQEAPRFRAQSLDGALSFLHASSSADKPGRVLRDTVCLEQLVG